MRKGTAKMNTLFRAHIIKKRRMRCSHRWFCVTRELGPYVLPCQQYKEYGPFRLKRDAKVFKASAKKSYV
jgi:hypothetical protein